MNYIRENTRRVRGAFAGCDLPSRLKLLGVACLQSVPNHIRQRVRVLDRTLESNTVRLMEKGAWVENGGLKFNAVDFATLAIIDDSFEPFMLAFQPRSGDVVLDVGANVGKYTFESARKVGPRGRVVAVEPNPQNFAALERGLIANKIRNVVPFRVAASDQNGDIMLYTGINSGTHSFVRNHGRGGEKVPCRVLDDLLEGLRLPRLDWIKIDVEGAEYPVLKGLVRSLKILRPAVVVEVWEKNERDVLALFSRLGYVAERLAIMDGVDFELWHCSYFLFRPR